MGIIVYLLDIFILHDFIPIVRLLIGSLVGVVLYILFARFFKFESLNEIINILKKR
jgi:hypothetical protein